MALPQQIDRASPADSDNPSAGASSIRQLKTFIEDVFTLSDATNYTVAPFAITTAGVVTAKVTPFNLAAGANFTFGPSDNFALILQTNATERMRLTNAGAWTLSAVGPHAIGGATTPTVALYQQGAFSPTGAAIGFQQNMTLSPTSGNQAWGLRLVNTLINTAGTAPDFANLDVTVPTITINGGAVTNAASVIIRGAPTGATNNYALWVAAGNFRLDGSLYFDVGVDRGYLSGSSGFLNIISGSTGLRFYANNGSTERLRLTDGGILAHGTTMVTDAVSPDLVLAHAGSLRLVNNAGTSAIIKAISIDSNDRVQLGTSAYLPAIPYVATAAFGSGGIVQDGRIAIDATTPRFVFYANGARYYVTGTSF